jgi:hypothetical protein
MPALIGEVTGHMDGQAVLSTGDVLSGGRILPRHGHGQVGTLTRTPR